MKKIFILVSFGVIVIISSCSSNNSEKQQNIDRFNAMNGDDTIEWPQRTIEDTSTCGCGKFSIYKKIDSLGLNFWFAFETKMDVDPIRSVVALNFPRDTSYFHPYLVDFSSEGNCMAPFCREIFINKKPCDKGEEFEIINGEALLYCSDGFREGNNSLHPKLYYVGALFHNLVFANKKDTIEIKTLKIPATKVGWTHG